MRAGRIQKIDILFSELRCHIEISLAECGTATASPILWKRNFKTERFQHFHCGYPDLWFVITHERVVPQNHFSSLPVGRDSVEPTNPFLKPAIESFVRVVRQ